MENCQKKPPVVPLYPMRPTHTDVNQPGKPEKNPSIRWRKDMWRCKEGGNRSTPLVSLRLLRCESRRVFCSLPLYFISSLSHSPLFIPSCCLPPHTTYIYYPAVCCRWALLAAFPSLGRMQETRWRERTKTKEIRVSNSVHRPGRVARLMAAKLGKALINTHLS